MQPMTTRSSARRRHPQRIGMILPAAGHQAVRDVVSIPTSRLGRMRRDHRLTGSVGDHPRQQARMAGIAAEPPIGSALGQAPLHRLP